MMDFLRDHERLAFVVVVLIVFSIIYMFMVYVAVKLCQIACCPQTLIEDDYTESP